VPLWKKLWILFTVIWVVVAGLNVATIVAFSEGEVEQRKALWPLGLAVAVPALIYLLLWAWASWRQRKR
jgi:hypothetical protein